MDAVHHLLVLVHLVAFAAVLGGAVVQLRSREPEVNAAMLHGAWVCTVSGGVLWALAGTFHVHVAVGPMVVKSVLAAVVTVLVVLNRRFFSIPRGLLRLIVALVLADAAVAVFW